MQNITDGVDALVTSSDVAVPKAILEDCAEGLNLR